MVMTTTALRSVLNCFLGALATVAFAANAAAAPAPAPAPPPKPHIPYQGASQSDVGDAYGYRTRILTGTPGCQRFAAESDAVFLDDKMDDQVKVDRLKSIGAAAAASGCLMP